MPIQSNLNDRWFEFLFEANPQPMTIYDIKTYQFLAVNQAACIQYGYTQEEFLNLTVLEVRHPDDIPEFIKSIKTTCLDVGSGFQSSGIWRHLKKDDSTIYIEISRHLVEFNNRKCICTLINDITDRLLTEKTLQYSEASLAEAQHIAHIGNWEWDIFKNTFQCSKEAARILSLKYHDKTNTMNIDSFISTAYPEDKPLLNEMIQKSLRDFKPWSLEHRILCQNSLIYVKTKGRITFDKNNCPARMFGTIQNITEQKKIEEELRNSRKEFRELSAFLQSALEENRTNIARELHDELGQSLTALDLGLSWISTKLKPPQAELKEKLENLRNIVNFTIEAIQRIASNLRPPALDDLGPAAAIEGLLEEFHSRTGIEFDLKLSQEEFYLEDKVITNIFRILQEALTNITRHASATKVYVRLNQVNKEIILQVQDNGNGFDMAQHKKKPSLGLLGIRERVRMLNGKLIISSAINAGTLIETKIPIGMKT
ncbi:MAG: PAS domain-containing protein [Proteobacteria bacterium]|nr:PAS domain-containing protein [Pseudomonadota bacterium]